MAVMDGRLGVWRECALDYLRQNDKLSLANLLVPNLNFATELAKSRSENAMRFGIQLYPPCTAPEMAAYAKKALGQYAFDKVWVPDHLTYENVFVILAAIIARTGAHVGTSVTHPWARTPVDLASSFAALAHLAGDRGITVGIGAGSPSSTDPQTKRVMVRKPFCLREMFAEKTRLGAYPH
jgi:hypothetical protein